MFYEAIHGLWKMEIPILTMLSLQMIAEKVIFANANDAFCLLTVGSSSFEYISNVSKFKLFKRQKEQWLVYQLKSQDKELVLRNLTTNDQQSFKNVISYYLSKDGNILVLKTALPVENKRNSIFKLDRFTLRKPKLIWKGYNPSNVIFDAEDATSIYG